MALRMTRPWKHPKTGMYHFRRAVPKDLWTLVGRREEKRSLGTKDPEAAKKQFIVELAKCEARWAELRSDKQRLTEQEAHVIAERVHDEWLDQHGDNPTLQFWDTSLFDRLWSEPEYEKSGHKEQLSLDQLLIPKMRRICRVRTRKLIEDLGLRPDVLGLCLLERAVAAAMQRASLKMHGVTQGTISPKDFARDLALLRQTLDTDKTRNTAFVAPSHSQVSLQGMLEGWWREGQVAGIKVNTYQNYRNTLTNFVKFIGHDDATRITSRDVVAFKDHRLQTISPKLGRPPSAKTVKDGDLAALKSLFSWAKNNHLLSGNPAAGVTIKLKKPVRLRSKGFTDVEGRLILAAALKIMPNVDNRRTSAAKKWVPWLCAFTGARVGEMAQLRKEDIRQVGDLWIVRVTPEAGTVKNNEAREIVLHRQIVELGFLSFVQSSRGGHLFLRPNENGAVLGPLQGLKNRLAEFSRSIVTDLHVQPTHGWRHRFKTIGMESGVDSRVLDAIQGHGVRSVADTYGDNTLKVIALAIEKLPDIKVDEAPPL